MLAKLNRFTIFASKRLLIFSALDFLMLRVCLPGGPVDT
jgi:hypothetical protein